MSKSDLYELFQKALVDARQNQNLTQTEVAMRLGKPQSYVSKYEIGERRLDVVEFIKVCEALNISPKIILERMGVNGCN